MKQFLEQSASFIRSFRSDVTMPYASIEEFVLKHGRTYESKKLTRDEIRYVKAVARSSGCKFKIKECYFNAQMLLADDIGANRLSYVEGYASGVIPVLHGWCEINGKVIDLTMRFWKNDSMIEHPPYGAGVFGETQDRQYIGVKIPRKIVLDRMLKHKEASSLLDDFENRWPLLQQEWTHG
jgi:hypothetical protein